MIVGGLWHTVDDIDSKVDQHHNKALVTALQTQIKFRRFVLGAQNTNGILNLSKAGKQLDVATLTANLKCVIRMSLEEMNEVTVDEPMSPPTPLSQERLEEQKRKILDLVHKENARIVT
jgi:hypothetical protein